MVMPSLPLQRFPFGHDNLKNILVRPFKFGMWVYMGLQFQSHWWPLKGQMFSHFGPVLIYRKLDHPMSSVSMQKFDLEALH